MSTSRTISIAIAAGILIIGVAAYFLWMRQDTTPNVTVSGFGATTETQALFLSLAAQLEPVSFDPRVLSDPRFTILEDIHTTILPEASGRTDPFAPLSGVAASR